MSRSNVQKEFFKDVMGFALDYLDQNPAQPAILEFIDFLKEHDNGDENDKVPTIDKVNSDADDLGIRLVLLNRYAKNYVKISLEDTELQTADEFPFLITLFAEGNHTKTELINKMLLTKTSGAEVLKRLLNKALIIESEDADDKRSKRVDLSEKGKLLVLNLLPRMGKVSKLICGNLSTSELRTTNYHLKKLVNYHRNVFDSASNEELKSSILSG